MVDRDIEPYRTPINCYEYSDCLFYTDERDMEALLWSTDSGLFRRLLIHIIRSQNVDNFKIAEKSDELFKKITQSAYQLGIIRFIVEDSDYSRKGIKVNPRTDMNGRVIFGTPTPYDYYDPVECSIDIMSLIDKYLCVQESHRREKQSIELAYKRNVTQYTDEMWRIIRGHDLSQMMLMTFNNWRPFNRRLDISDFEMLIRCGYQKHLIYNSQLGNKISSWINSFLVATA